MKRFVGYLRGTWKSILASTLIFTVIAWVVKLIRGEDFWITILSGLAFGLFIALLWSYKAYGDARDLKKKLGAIDLRKLGDDMVLIDHYNGGQRVIEINGVYKNTKVRIVPRFEEKETYLDIFDSDEKLTQIRVYHRITEEMLATGLRNALIVARERKRLR